MKEQQYFEISSLGYLIVASDKLDEWKSFAGASLGMQLVEKSKRIAAFRMDERGQRLIISDESRPSRYTIGWEAVSLQSLELIAVRLEQSGVVVTRANTATASERMVRDLISFRDPVGNSIEVFHGPILADTAFIPGRSHSGFRTGSLGLGHVVLTAGSLNELMPFYRDLLGFRVSDYQRVPFQAFFFHTNRRHHSLALIQLEEPGIHHVMLEHTMLDDVGQGYDVVQSNDYKIGVTLGRHTNDRMTSFYVHTPSPFMIEVGWGGLEIDPDLWQAVELKDGPSLWGHDRSWLSPEQFAVAKRMRLKAAAEGSRAPVNVLPGRYLVGQEG